MKKILLSLFLVVGALGALTAGATGAFFSDTETSIGNVFAAGELDLKIDNESYYNGVLNSSTTWTADNLDDGDETLHLFFDFNDVKPDDEGEDTISIHVQNDAWMCMDVTLTANDDVSTTEPESLVDDENQALDLWDGELAQALQMFWWADDGDNVYEVGEETISDGIATLYDLATTSPFSVALADSDDNVWNEAGAVPANEPRYLAKAWCFGTLGEAPIAQDALGKLDGSTNGPLVRGTGFTCDGAALGNETQTDRATLDVAFSAVQARNNPTFQCVIPVETRECVQSEEYASAFHSVDQGRRKNGTGILADRTDPSDALGAPQHPLGLPYDSPVVAGSFFALGFKATPANATATTTPGGSIVLSFPGNIVNGTGPDLKLWEVTGGTVYPDELVRVEVSTNLAGPWTLVTAGATRDAEMELPIPSAKYVRITDVSPPGPFETTADGFDLDAVQALNCEIPLAN